MHHVIQSSAYPILEVGNRRHRKVNSPRIQQLVNGGAWILTQSLSSHCALLMGIKQIYINPCLCGQHEDTTEMMKPAQRG